MAKWVCEDEPQGTRGAWAQVLLFQESGPELQMGSAHLLCSLNPTDSSERQACAHSCGSRRLTVPARMPL